ncbi:MAG: hypothetical protein GY721_02005 [Deltaproteobacteria bacterium]|nr:hypothetical protein [Deltaproteobacteria bacterium]
MPWEGVAEVIEEMWERYPNGLVAHLQEKAVPKVAGLARYIAKYVVSPPMALSRLIEYDREKGKVKYWYKDHKSGQRREEEMEREQFIGRMVQHILPKGFKRIRYYGLQATCKLKKVGGIVKGAVERVVVGVLDVGESGMKKLSYRARMKRAYGKDPLMCERCGVEMWLWKIWHPEYGEIHDELAEIEGGKYDQLARAGPGEVKEQPKQDVQLPLFDMPLPFVYA